MKDFYTITDDIKKDCDKISKVFISRISYFFSKYYEIAADEWYNYNKVSNPVYERTYQLKEKALLEEKIGNFELRLSFSSKNIKRRSARLYNKESKKPAKLGSYVSFNGEDVASSVLQWEEEGIHGFSRYNYKKGGGIWSHAVQLLIARMDSIPMDTTILQTHLPTQIKNDLVKELKKSVKKQLEQQYFYENE